MTAAPPEGGTIRLGDGRRLGHADFGLPLGRPVLYFHGFPGSRLEAALGHALACSLGIRLIGVERPGYGLSDPKPGRTLDDWRADIAELADALDLPRFGVLGISGGAPYAAACAAGLPERVTATAIVGGLGPLEGPTGTAGMAAFNRAGLWIAGRAPRLLGLLGPLVAYAAGRHPEWLIRHLEAITAPADRAALEDPELRGTLTRSFREAVRRGPEGMLSDARVFARPWGSLLETIRGPMGVWHGERDVIVPPGMGRAVVSAVPGARGSFEPEDGHFSIVRRHMRAVLSFAAG